MRQRFGAEWTAQKLECVLRYLEAYAQVMKKQDYLRTHYIDAFAGTGYVELRRSLSCEPGLFAEFEQTESESRTILQGSAEQALKVRPAFHTFTFIEQCGWRSQQLAGLKEAHPALAASMRIVTGDANQELRSICAGWNCQRDRAVVFLDPFGMSVDWATLEAINATCSMDIWYLFPIMAVNRLLPRTKNPLDVWERRLNLVFGTEDWRNHFYTRKPTNDLLSWYAGTTPEEEVSKVGDWDSIRDFLLDRLQQLFPFVADNPLFLRNSTTSPMFLLCFAASNPNGTAGKIALRIAQHILQIK